jgi:predicted nucleic acid-binding protein
VKTWKTRPNGSKINGGGGIVIFDTDVLVWFMRGKSEAAKALASVPKESRFISVITYLELIQGIRDKAELKLLKEMFPQTGLTILPLSENIGQVASDLMEKFKLSSGLEVQDALIAASASAYQDTLYTGNLKHFKGLAYKLRLFTFNARSLSDGGHNFLTLSSRRRRVRAMSSNRLFPRSRSMAFSDKASLRRPPRRPRSALTLARSRTALLSTALLRHDPNKPFGHTLTPTFWPGRRCL